jgi:hypothetical protein
MLHRQGGRVDLLQSSSGSRAASVILICSNYPTASGSGGWPRSGAAVAEQVAPVAGHLGEEPGLAAPAEQVPHYRDGQQLGISAGRDRSGRSGTTIAPPSIRP